MKKSLKLLVLPAAMVLCAGNLTSCTAIEKEIAMISDVGDIDDGGFNQGCWEAVQNYGKLHNKSYDYYRPFADSDFARKCAVKQAVTKGAKIIILPGFKFSDGAASIANENKDTKFVLIDASIDNPPKNLICVTYDFAKSGWLAGYCVANDYFYTDYYKDHKLKDNYGFGYFGGMANPGVSPVGFGYIQGILYAAQEFTTTNNCNKPFINIEFDYAGVFLQDDMACIKCKGWLTNSDPKYNTKVIFACGGKLYQSVTEAVNYYNDHFLPESIRHFEDQKAPREAARWIGVDGNQYNLVKDENAHRSIYTSALKDVGQTVTTSLDYFYNDCWNELTENEEGKHVHVGLNSQFVEGSTHAWDNSHSFVGIPSDAKKNDVLIGFNNITKTDLGTAAGIIGGLSIYDGFDKIGQKGYGYPSYFNTNEYITSTYNNDEHGKKYSLNNYIVHCEVPKQ